MLLRVLVTGVRLVKPMPHGPLEQVGQVEVEYEVLERFKGSPPLKRNFRAKLQLWPWDSTRCSGGTVYTVGWEYILFSGKDPNGPTHITQAISLNAPHSDKRLQEIRALTTRVK